jgi:hypothetical protein
MPGRRPPRKFPCLGPLRPTVGSTLGITTLFSVHYPINVVTRQASTDAAARASLPAELPRQLEARLEARLLDAIFSHSFDSQCPQDGHAPCVMCARGAIIRRETESDIERHTERARETLNACDLAEHPWQCARPLSFLDQSPSDCSWSLSLFLGNPSTINFSGQFM